MPAGKVTYSQKEIDSFLKNYEPMIKRTVSVRMRGLADNVSSDDLMQAGRVAVWESINKFDGRGQMGAYVLQQIKFALAENLRTNHPAGRYGRKIVGISDDAAMEAASSDDDPVAELQRKQEFQLSMNSMSKKDRASVVSALAGRPSESLVKRVENLVSERREKTTSLFNPFSVLITTGDPVPPIIVRVKNKYKQLANRMPATGACVLGRVQAASLVRVMTEEKIKFMTRKLADGNIKVFREPSQEQVRGNEKKG
jgi:DNA-directed RNA polymerase specialized sigma24 family protein